MDLKLIISINLILYYQAAGNHWQIQHDYCILPEILFGEESAKGVWTTILTLKYRNQLQVIPSSSPEMLRLALRALHTYASGGEIVGLELELTGLVFGMNAHGREVIEGRIVIQVHVWIMLLNVIHREFLGLLANTRTRFLPRTV